MFLKHKQILDNNTIIIIIPDQCAKCAKCDAKITKKSVGVSCSGECRRIFHVKCTDISKEFLEIIKQGKASWKCIDCPLQSNESLIISEQNDDNEEKNSTDASENPTECLNMAINNLNATDLSNCSLDNLAQYLKTLGTVLCEISKSQSYISLQMDDLVKQNKGIIKENQHLKECLVNAEAKSISLEQKVNHLESKLDEFQNKNYRNNIVIAGLPSTLENPRNTILNIASKINANISNNDIVSVTSVNKKTNDKTPMKKLYIIQFNSKESKAEMMTKKKENFKHLFTDELNILGEGNKEIFFRHHLSALQSRLYYEAKQIKTAHNFKFLWVQNGQILLRMDTTSKVYKVMSFNDITFIKNTFSILS